MNDSFINKLKHAFEGLKVKVQIKIKTSTTRKKAMISHSKTAIAFFCLPLSLVFNPNITCNFCVFARLTDTAAVKHRLENY